MEDRLGETVCFSVIDLQSAGGFRVGVRKAVQDWQGKTTDASKKARPGRTGRENRFRSEARRGIDVRRHGYLIAHSYRRSSGEVDFRLQGSGCPLRDESYSTRRPAARRSRCPFFSESPVRPHSPSQPAIPRRPHSPLRIRYRVRSMAKCVSPTREARASEGGRAARWDLASSASDSIRERAYSMPPCSVTKDAMAVRSSRFLSS